MAEITKKASRLLAGLACTCPGSILFALIEKYGIGGELFENLFKVESFLDLRKIVETNDGDFQTFVIASHFVGIDHFEYAKKSMSIAKEVPDEFRPVLHQILPLGKNDVYENKMSKIKFENLVEIGYQRGSGFWAAHLCGKVWVPAKMSFMGDIKREQLKTQGFVEMLEKISEVRMDSYPELYGNTLEAKRILSKYL